MSASAFARVLATLDGCRRVLAGTLGANAYVDYLAHHRRAHPGEEPLSERAFWRERAREQDRNPSARCC